jgi:hypothetical protein
MKGKIVTIVISSECTWRHLMKYCFNINFQVNRNKFDLCVVFNGNISEAISYITKFNPEYLLQRPNLGMDPAALDYALKVLPSYEYYIILHDDHWFHTPDWFDYLTGLLMNDSAVGAYGNLVTYCPYQSEVFDNFFWQISTILMNDNRYSNFMHPYYLQGMAGIFRRLVFDKFNQYDGVPHIHSNGKKTVEVLERLFSYLLLNNKIVIKQIPPGFELYLRHRDHNKCLTE